MLAAINKIDNYIIYIVRSHFKNKYMDMLMPIITDLGNLGFVWIMIAAVLIINKPYRLVGDLVIITLIVSTIMGEGIVKHIIRRTRPCDVYNNACLLITRPITYSFPSGHTLSSFAAAGVLSVYLSQYKFIFISLAFLIAISRLYLCVHYPSDIIAGIIAGILCSKLIFIMTPSDYIQNLIFFINSLF